MTTAAVRPSLAVNCGAATNAVQLDFHHRIRHQVFVAEQRLFDPSDLDRHDGEADCIRVLGLVGSHPAGTVRLFPLDPAGQQWQGDRLAVLHEWRAHGVGKPLVLFAVATAGALGGNEMVAHIQLANVSFFEHIGWHKNGAVEQYIGVAHQPMAIALHR